MKVFARTLSKRVINFSFAFIVAFSSLTAVMPFVNFQSAAALTATQFNQDFETNTNGWVDNTAGGYGTITRVPSGNDGIASADGSWHAVVEEDASSAPFTRFHGYQTTWTGPWTSTVDVYLDPSWAAGEGFDYSVASNDTVDHLRDFVAHVSKDTSTGSLLFAASNNTSFSVREDLETLNHYEVTAAGWYTISHHFYNNGGTLAADISLLNSAGTVLFTETRNDATDLIPSVVGGNRYGWFTFVGVAGGLSIDNTSLESTVPDVAKPVVSFVSPSAEGQAFGGDLDVVFDATDNGGLSAVTVNIKDSANVANVGSCGSTSGLGGVLAYTLNCTIDTTSFADGVYYLRAGATDTSANNKTISRQVIFDNTKPTVAITSPSNGSLLPGSFVVNGTASDATSGIANVLYTITKIDALGGNYVSSVSSGTATGTTNFSLNASGLTNGYYRVKFQAFDNAGNWRYKQIDVQVDADKPVVSIVTPVVDSYNPTQIAIDATDNVSLDVVTANIYDESNTTLIKSCSSAVSPALSASYTLNCAIPALADGVYTIRTNARDMVGKVSQTLTRQFTIDTTRPNINDELLSDTVINATDANPTLTATLEDATSPIVRAQYRITDASDAVVVGWTDLDAADGSFDSMNEAINSSIDVSALTDGTYTLRLRAFDGADNRRAALLSFSIDRSAPVVTVTGGNTSVEAGATYTEQGATWTDDADGAGDAIIVSSNVGTTIPGVYTVSYSYTDTAGNTGTADRTVTVVDTTAPVITLNGSTTITLTVGDTYTEEGATWTDFVDAAGVAFIGGDVVDADVAGTYIVTYDYTDAAGNVALQVTRTVIVEPADEGEVLGEQDNDNNNEPVEEDQVVFQNVVNEDTTTNNTDDQEEDTSSTTSGTNSDVEGESDDKNAGTIFGLAWYWWLLILAALGAILWWIIGALRNRNQEQQ